MFIIKFNNMVKNKWVWAAFAIVVAVAFGASDIMYSARQGQSDRTLYGLLDGQPIDSIRYSAVSSLLRFQQRGDEAREIKPRDVWRAYAALVTAEKMGLSVSDAELARIIQSMPDLKNEAGAFDEARYQGMLRVLGLSPIAYQEVVRADVMLSQLGAFVQGGPYGSPSMAEDRARGMNDDYVIQTATVSNAFTAAAAEVSPEAALSFYEKNAESYREPERRTVQYVAFRAKDFLGEATFEEEEVQAYYDEHEDDYVVQGTNDVETVKTLEEVRPEIEAALADQHAREKAAAAAAAFADVFYEADEEQAASMDFAEEAKKAGYEVTLSQPFADRDFPVLYSESPAFVEACFGLDGESLKSRVTDVIGGEGPECYVACLVTNVPSHVPAYADISDRVLSDAKVEQAEASFNEAVNKARDSIMLGLEKEGAVFADLARESGLEVSTNITLNCREAYGGVEGVPAARSIAMAMTQLGKGDFCKEAFPVFGGAVFFYVVDRTPGDANTFSIGSKMMMSAMSREMGEGLWEEWLDKNLESLNPQPNEPFEGDEAVAEEDEEEAEEA